MAGTGGKHFLLFLEDIAMSVVLAYEHVGETAGYSDQ